MEASVYDLLTGRLPLREILVTRKDGLEMIPSGIALSRTKEVIEEYKRRK